MQKLLIDVFSAVYGLFSAQRRKDELMDCAPGADTVFYFHSLTLARAEMMEVDRESALLLTSEVKSCQNRSPSNKHHPLSRQVTLEPEQTEEQLSEPEAKAQSDEDDDVSEEEVTNANRKRNRKEDKDWLPRAIPEDLSEVRGSSEDSDGELELSDQEPSSKRPHHLCSECGAFHWAQHPHTCKHKVKPHACNVCGRRYATETSLRKHSKSHNDFSEHFCVYCYSTVITKQHKLAHQQVHQTQMNPYRCRHCSSSFASLVERTKHMKSHRGPFEYKCDICGISFGGQKNQLERHVMVHTGVKPYKCSVCERGFNQEGHLKSHMRLHTGERPYACPHCDKAFNHNVSLKSHLQRYHPPESGAAADNGGDGDSQEFSETEPGCDHKERKQDTERQQRETEETRKMRKKYNRTGRPKGRPKRPAAETGEGSKEKSSRQNKKDLYDHDDDEKEGPTFRKKTLSSGKPRGQPRKI